MHAINAFSSICTYKTYQLQGPKQFPTKWYFMEAFAGKLTLPMQDTVHGHSYVDMQIQHQLQCQQQHAASQSIWQSKNRR